jgi:hypothetical protein
MTEEVKKQHHHKEDKPLDKMTAIELKEIAHEIEGENRDTGVDAMKKEELLAFIKKAKGIKDEPHPHHHAHKKTSKVELSKQDLKAKISALKKVRLDARETKDKDKKKIKILRRRINRLKKRLRKVA